MELFPRRLKECSEKLKSNNSKWTQGFVAEKLKVARTTYTAYENGTKTPTHFQSLNRGTKAF